MDLDCDNEWENFCLDSNNYVNKTVENCDIETTNIPKCSDIYISTKTMIGYLNTKIDIHKVFWMLNTGISTKAIVTSAMALPYRTVAPKGR